MKITKAEFVTSAVNPANYPAGQLPEVALAGRSNVGKSSLLNKLLNRKRLARTSNTPGRTRLINFFLVNSSFHLVDLPGYGYAKVPMGERDSWKKMIESYLNTRTHLKGLLLLVDSRHPPTAMDLQMYAWLKYRSLPAVIVATKADKLSRSRLQQSLRVIRSDLGLAADDALIPFSAVTGQGREELLAMIGQIISSEQAINHDQT
ncbi:MAG: YihA family ribosome biogenesis GTP-binding protein [Peptococcaceae bacterium]|jgi:GTP-binding protein|nr:YihA family ribosome biogenesis GTP-binding protein [Peptococcaceae bacterium]